MTQPITEKLAGALRGIIDATGGNPPDWLKPQLIVGERVLAEYDALQTPAPAPAPASNVQTPAAPTGTGGIDWYERRHELSQGQIFSTCTDGVVQLDRRVPGDGSKWYVLDWHDGWAHYDSTIEPGDLVELLDPEDYEPERR